MSVLKTLVCVAILGLSLGIPSARTATAAPSLLDTFAQCAGRYSAEVEHGWLFPSRATDGAEDHRDTFTELAQTLQDDTTAKAALAHRIAAKHAQKRLLSASAFATDPVLKSEAARRAQVLIASCNRLLLDS